MADEDYTWRPVVLELPFSLDPVRWKPILAERRSAYALYVELQHLPGALTRLDGPDEQLPPRLILRPFAEIGQATRRVLDKGGPRVGDRPSSFGQIAMNINATGFRPFVERWGSRLSIHEATRAVGMDRVAHDLLWPELRNFLSEAKHLRTQLLAYVDLLARMGGVLDAERAGSTSS